MKRISVTSLVAMLVVALLGVSASASVGSKERPQARLRHVAQELDDQGSARFEGDITVEGGSIGAAKTITFSGELDFDGGTGRFTMDGSSLGLPGGDIEYLLVDNVAYFSSGAFGALSSEIPGLADKKWLRIDPEALGAGGEQLQQNDPTGFLEALRGVSRGVETIGPEDVRGVTTTHYRADLDLEKALAKVPEAERDKVEKALSAFGDANSIPIDIWIDRDDLPRRFAMSFEAAEAEGAKVALGYELFDFGTDVSVEAPPDDEVADFSEFLSQIFRQLPSETGS